MIETLVAVALLGVVLLVVGVVGRTLVDAARSSGPERARTAGLALLTEDLGRALAAEPTGPGDLQTAMNIDADGLRLTLHVGDDRCVVHRWQRRSDGHFDWWRQDPDSGVDARILERFAATLPPAQDWRRLEPSPLVEILRVDPDQEVREIWTLTTGQLSPVPWLERFEGTIQVQCPLPFRDAEGWIEYRFPDVAFEFHAPELEWEPSRVGYW